MCYSLLHNHVFAPTLPVLSKVDNGTSRETMFTHIETTVYMIYARLIAQHRYLWIKTIPRTVRATSEHVRCEGRTVLLACFSGVNPHDHLNPTRSRSCKFASSWVGWLRPAHATRCAKLCAANSWPTSRRGKKEKQSLRSNISLSSSAAHINEKTDQ